MINIINKNLNFTFITILFPTFYFKNFVNLQLAKNDLKV